LDFPSNYSGLQVEQELALQLEQLGVFPAIIFPPLCAKKTVIVREV